MKQIDLEAIKARCEAARRELRRLCQGKTSWTRNVSDWEDETNITLTDSFRDIPMLLAEVKRLQIEAEEWKTTAEEKWMVAYLSERKCNELRAEVERLQCELHDEQVRRDEWKKMYDQAIWEPLIAAEKLQIEVKRLRASLEAVLEEAESDLDRDVILTECWSALSVKMEAT